MSGETPFAAEYRLAIAGESGAESGACSVTFPGSGISVTPQGGISIEVRYSEISGWRAEDYCIDLNLADGSVLALSKLARRYDEFIDTFRTTRREHFFTALLLEEGEHIDIDGAFELQNPAKGSISSGACSVSLQKTSLACFPDNSLPFLIPYGSILEIVHDQELYGIRITCDDGRKLVLMRFARRTDELQRSLEERRTALYGRQSLALSTLAPNLGAIQLRKIASLLRDGTPAGKRELESAAPGFWDAVWNTGFCEKRREYAEVLLTKATEVYVVIKETGPWGASDDTPVALADRRMLYLFRIDTALVVETPSTDDAATYIFKITGECQEFIRTLCKALATIQFRREPVYLPEAELVKPPYDRYSEAIRIVPELTTIRAAFRGRAIHNTLESWQKTINDTVGQV